MATSSSICKLIKLNGDNHPARKLQLWMALIWDDLWDIMNSSEKPPVGEAATADARKKFMPCSNKALSMIVLSMEPELHYRIGREPEDPVAVWKLLTNHFECKAWGNCYELWKQLFTMPRMKEKGDGGSVDVHLKLLQETFDSQAVLEDPVSEKKQEMFILASLPGSFQRWSPCWLQAQKTYLCWQTWRRTPKQGAEAETSRLCTWRWPRKSTSCRSWSKVIIFERQANLSLLWQARPFEVRLQEVDSREE